MSLEDELRAEIRKWTDRLDERIRKTDFLDAHGEEMLENIQAYREDSEHFSKCGDLVKSFECLVWAWALLETGTGLGHLRVETS
jgi:hypothetical protein